MKTPSRTTMLALLAIPLVGILAYANTFSVPFQFDDEAYVVNNPVIRDIRPFFNYHAITSGNVFSPTALPEVLRHAFITRILGYLSLAVNYRLHGLDVAGYHVVNLLFHILNALLVYWVLIHTFRTVSSLHSEKQEKTPEIFAFIASLIFLCHPIQTHAVTYITSRFVLLASFFSLLSLAAYIRFRLSAAGPRRLVILAISVTSLAAAMLTKEISFTAPFLIALYEVSFFTGSLRERVRALAPLALTLPIIPLLVFLQQGSLDTLDATMRNITAADVSQISRGDYLLTQFRVVAMYLRLLFLPVGQNIDHDILIQHSLTAPAVLGSLLLLMALLAFAGYCHYLSTRNTHIPELRVVSVGILWFFISLSVESSIIPLGELSAEYRLYLPSIGMIMAVTSLGAAACRFSPNRKAFYVIVAVLIVLLCVATMLRNRVWRSEISLWEDAAGNSPARMRPHQNLGLYYSMQGRLGEALGELQKAIRIEPRDYELHNNLGIVYKLRGELTAAIREYRIALQLNPKDPMAHYNLGNIYLMQGNLPEAIREYQSCLKGAPDYDEAHNNLGIAYERSGRSAEAIVEFGIAVRLNPENRHARDNLAKSLRKQHGGTVK
jgi:tetratricopeptide (TPR) repeat protein